MTKDEALKLALEFIDSVKVHPTQIATRDAIHTAIKQALAAPVQEPVAWMYEDMMGLVGVVVRKKKPIVARPVTPLYTTPPAQPAPVQERLHEAFSKREQDNWLSEIADALDDPTLTSFGQIATGIRDLKERLSTPPAAQRQWVGLTQQDIDIAFDDTQEGGGFDDFSRAIEAKLKEKNNG